MAKLPFNPLKWFVTKQPPPKPPAAKAPLSTRPATPKKNGSIFMHLINLQKTLQALELALRQDMETAGLLRKAKEIVSALQFEAGNTQEEELAQTAGQVLAYLETVLEGRLDLDEAGISAILDFVVIFKDILTDATLRIHAPNNPQLREWNEHYQELMARMKPIEEEIASPEVPEVQVVMEDSGGAEPVLETSEAREGSNEVAAPEEIPFGEVVLEQQDSIPVDAPAAAETEDLVEESPEVDEVIEEVQLVESPPDQMISDVVIPDSETRSARELLESLEPISLPAHGLDQKETLSQEVESPGGNGFEIKRNGDGPVKTPVQLEEVERLKKKLLQLHEKQEILSYKMSGILGDLKKSSSPEQPERKDISIEKMDMEEIEDLIFIGRKKG